MEDKKLVRSLNGNGSFPKRGCSAPISVVFVARIAFTFLLSKVPFLTEKIVYLPRIMN